MNIYTPDKIFVEDPPFVELLQFETSTICDGACVFCARQHAKRRGVAKWSTLFEVIDNCARYAYECCPFMLGEPLLEPRLIPILDNLKQVNSHIQTKIYTNMNSMTPKKAEQWLDSELIDTLIISFTGPNASVYKKYQPAFNWQRTRRNIKMFMQMRKKKKLTKPEVKLHTIMFPEIVPYQTQIREEWGSIVDHIGFTNYRTHFKNDPLFPNQDEFLRKHWGEPASSRVPCPRPFLGFYIRYNGDVVPCCEDCTDDFIMGNINEQSWRKIWWGQKYKQFRRDMLGGEYVSFCKECDHWQYEISQEFVNYWQNKLITCGPTS